MVEDNIKEFLLSERKKNSPIVKKCKKIASSPTFNKIFNFLMDNFRLMDISLMGNEKAIKGGKFFEDELPNYEMQFVKSLEVIDPKFQDLQKIISSCDIPDTKASRVAYSSLAKVTAYFFYGDENFEDKEDLSLSLMGVLLSLNENIYSCLADCLIVKAMAGEIIPSKIDNKFITLKKIPRKLLLARYDEFKKNNCDILNNSDYIEPEILSYRVLQMLSKNPNEAFNAIYELFANCDKMNDKDIYKALKIDDVDRYISIFGRSFGYRVSFFENMLFDSEEKTMNESSSARKKVISDTRISNEVSSKYISLFTKKKILELLDNEDFVNHCNNVRAFYPNLDEIIDCLGMISQLEVDSIEDEIASNVKGTYLEFNKENLINDAKDFFTWFDETRLGNEKNNTKNRPETMLSEEYEKNLKYLKFDETGYRSYCSWSGSHEIYVGAKSSIRDRQSLCHECTHSFCSPYKTGRVVYDEELIESPTVIVDKLSYEFFKHKYPETKENYNKFLAIEYLENVVSSRSLLMQALICKMVTQKQDCDKILDKYGAFFLQNEQELKNCLKAIDSRQMDILGEYKYVFPTLLADELLQKNYNNPKNLLDDITFMIKNIDTTSIDEMLKSLGLPKYKDLFIRYSLNFDEKLDNILNDENSPLKDSMQDYFDRKKTRVEDKTSENFLKLDEREKKQEL